MANHDPVSWKGREEDSINAHFQNVLKDYKKSASAPSRPYDDQPHKGVPSSGAGYRSLVSTGPLMNWTQMLEAMNAVQTSLAKPNDDIIDEQIPQETGDGGDMNGDTDKELLDELNRIFTPILVMQGFEADLSSAAKMQEAALATGNLTEKTMIQFDDASRMAQLISVCALLLQKKKNTQKWQMYAKAAEIRNRMKLDMQKEEYDAARVLAQKYLVKVATTNNSSVARDAAQGLLPETQH